MQKEVKIGLFLAILIAIILGGYFIKKAQKNTEIKPTTIRIGIVGHFSGKYADYGIPMKNAVELAIDEINQRGGINQQKLELVVEDDNSDANSAVTAVNKFISVDNLNYIISAQVSAITSVITPITQNNKKITMITLSSGPDLTMVGDYIFRVMTPDTYQAVKMNDFIENNFKSKKVAGLYINDAYGVGMKKIISSNPNVENVDSEMFEATSVDFRTQLLKIKESGADTLVVVAINEYPTILKQMKELRLNMNVIASNTLKDETMLAESGNNAEGVYLAFPTNKPENSVVFDSKYQAQFNEKPSAYSMYAYDGMNVLAKAIEQGNEVVKVENNLLNTNFDGASGKLSFSADRDRTGSEQTIFIIKNGQFVEVK